MGGGGGVPTSAPAPTKIIAPPFFSPTAYSVPHQHHCPWPTAQGRQRSSTCALCGSHCTPLHSTALHTRLHAALPLPVRVGPTGGHEPSLAPWQRKRGSSPAPTCHTCCASMVMRPACALDSREQPCPNTPHAPAACAAGCRAACAAASPIGWWPVRHTWPQHCAWSSPLRPAVPRGGILR